MKPCQAVTVLRSGKEIEKPTPPAHVPIAEEVEDEEEEQQIDTTVEEIIEDKVADIEKAKQPPTARTKEYEPPVPFPQALEPPSKERYQSDIREIFKQVKINIPLLEAINQIPAYAKFLKDKDTTIALVLKLVKLAKRLLI